MKVSRLIAALVLIASVSSAKAAIIAHWTFETSVPTTAGPHAAELGDNAGAGSAATGFHAGATTYSNPVGNGSLESFSSTNWATDDHYQFTTSTVGYTLIALEWCQSRSGTGPADFRVEGSTDGTNYSTLLASYTVLSTPSWSSNPANAQPSTCYAVNAPASFDNQATVFFRLTSNVTVASGGTSRVDDVKIVTVPEPATMSLLVIGALAALRRRR